MKKKPPPGATLIARLKEKRLQREGTPSDEDVAPVLDVEAEEIQAAEESSVEESHIESGSVEIALRESPAPSGDLLHSRISIDELRPSTDDYDALTEEIRLAGRFAAIGLIAQGLRLARIRHDEIHRHHFSSFEDYCRNEHQMSATYAYRLIRMAEMAEKFAERPTESLASDMPAAYEAMLSLGHRHLMALLPLPEDKVEEFLVRGVPLSDEGNETDERVPIERATEKQIRQALKPKDVPAATAASMAKRAEKMLNKELPKLAGMLEECANWLETSPAEMEVARMEKAEELRNLAERFRLASEKIFEALNSEP